MVADSKELTTVDEEQVQHLELINRQAQVSMFLNEKRFEFAQRIGNMLASSTMVPEHYRGNLGNCMIALNLAERLKVDVFGLMQTSYIVHGRPGFEAKLLIAVFNAQSKLFTPPLRWEMEGDFPKGKDAKCRAYAIDKETGEKVFGEWIDWPLVDAEGWNKDKPLRGGNGTIKSKWNTMPGQMFRYRAASFFINAYEPGLKMGITTVDELEDTVIDVTPREQGLKIQADTTDTDNEDKEDIYETKEVSQPETDNKAPETKTEDSAPTKDDEVVINQFKNCSDAGVLKWEENNRNTFNLMSKAVQDAFKDKFKRTFGQDYNGGPPVKDDPKPKLISCPERDGKDVEETECEKCEAKAKGYCD